METGILNRAVLDEGWRLFTLALEKVADEPILYDRVEKLTVGLYFTELKLPFIEEDRDQRIVYLEIFQDLCTKYRITAISEGGGYEFFIESIKAQLNLN